MQMMMDCSICAETFNNRDRKIVKCHYCFFEACHACVARFLLSKEEAVCMNCHKGWGYDFISSQMTRTFMKNPYKEHIKTILMREIENGLGAYQEMAVLLNKREEIIERLTIMDTRLQKLENVLNNQFEVKVGFHGRFYKLSMTLDKENVPEARHGAFMIHHVNRLVNPLPTEQDLAMADGEVKRLETEIQKNRIMHMCAVLNMNMFYTDKVLIALSSEIAPVSLSEEEKQETLKQMDGLRTEYSKHVNDLKEHYDSMTFDEAKVKDRIDQCRSLSRQFWKYYYRVLPPTDGDYKHIEEDKTRYLKMIDYYKKEIQQNQWAQEDAYDRIHSNTQYVYNVDDNVLYPLQETFDQRAMTESILEEEEKRNEQYIQSHVDEIRRLEPFYNDIAMEYTEIQKMIRKEGKKQQGTFIRNCPETGCIGKVDVDGKCGLCGHFFCHECMREKLEGHECKKEDVDTIRELHKNTRPCPKCSVPIYKIEGCDQMWCVQCHTTFSWKTGDITRGVVHNPHFYDYRRDMGGSIQRAPGDIPCGGLPNEIEILNATNNYTMYDLWVRCVRWAETDMPSIYRRFHNVRPVKYKRYSISYLRGIIDKKRLGVLLYKNYMNEIRYSHYYDIMETLVDNMSEYMRQYVNGGDTEKECLALLNIAQNDINEMRKKYDIKVADIF